MLWPRYADKRYIGVLRSLRLRIALSRIALWLELITQRFWPVWTLGLFTYAFVAFNGLQLISLNSGRVLTGIVALLGFFLLVRGFRNIRFPDKNAAIERLDLISAGSPLASLQDHPAAGKDDKLTNALWEAHQAKMADLAKGLHPEYPDLRLSRYDRYGLRLMALVCATSAMFFAPTGALDAVKTTLSIPTNASSFDVSLEGWATPPPYTGQLQVYLGDVPEGEILELPVGTKIVIQVYGGSDLVLEQNLSSAKTTFTGGSEVLQNTLVTIENSGNIEVQNGKNVLGSWRVITTLDNPPNVVAEQDIGQTTAGAMRLPFTATDDYGIVAGTATIKLDLDNVDRRFGLGTDPAPREVLETNLPLPYRGGTKSISEVLVEDFSSDQWVGLPVIVTLNVRDASGQTGTYQIKSTLPGKRFFVPLAAAFAEQRRDLLWSPENDVTVLQVLKAIINLPEDLRLSAGTYLKIKTTVLSLETMQADGLDASERAEITEALWRIAIFLEDGDLGDARARLQRAQEKLLEAIDQGAEREEISTLMEELREATDKYMELMAAEADSSTADERSAQQADGNDQLRQMLDELEQLAQNGEKDAARELLDEMRDIMDDMKLAEQQGGGNSEEMQQMQDALGQQQGLADETYRQLQQQLEDGLESDPNVEQTLSERQEMLRDFLDSLKGQQSANSRGLAEDAEENMKTSRDFLQEGELGKSLNEQADAIENLRETIRKLGEEQQQIGQGRNGLQEGETQDNPASNDPLGRPLGRTGTTESGNTAVPDQNASERARELLDEIRRRSGDLDRPEAEIEYLKRLLEQF